MVSLIKSSYSDSYIIIPCECNIKHDQLIVECDLYFPTLYVREEGLKNLMKMLGASEFLNNDVEYEFVNTCLLDIEKVSYTDKSGKYQKITKGKILLLNFDCNLNFSFINSNNLYCSNEPFFLKSYVGINKKLKELRQIDDLDFYTIFGYKERGKPYKDNDIFISNGIIQKVYYFNNDAISIKNIVGNFTFPEVCNVSESERILRLNDLEKRRKEKERDERERRRIIEFQKTQKGYCNICGTKGATRVADPFQLEINDSIVITELCADCYNNIAGDI